LTMKPMKYALFLGCTIPARSRGYELSARRVAKTLGIEFVDVEQFACCGFPMKSIDMISFTAMAAYNLCIAEEKNLDICTLCSSCASALTEVAYRLSKNAQERDRANVYLSRLGLKFQNTVKVRHFARVLYEEIDAAKIKEHFKKDLSGLGIAIHYGCHYLKPSEIYGGFDDVEYPRSIDTLVKLTGATVVDYPGKMRCCGGPVLPVNENVALSIAKQKLDDVSKSGASALCLVCPFCSVMYDANQKGIESQYGTSYNLPVLFLTQILGMAMGFDRKALGIKKAHPLGGYV